MEARPSDPTLSRPGGIDGPRRGGSLINYHIWTHNTRFYPRKQASSDPDLMAVRDRIRHRNNPPGHSPSTPAACSINRDARHETRERERERRAALRRLSAGLSSLISVFFCCRLAIKHRNRNPPLKIVTGTTVDRHLRGEQDRCSSSIEATIAAEGTGFVPYHIVRSHSFDAAAAGSSGRREEREASAQPAADPSTSARPDKSPTVAAVQATREPREPRELESPGRHEGMPSPSRLLGVQGRREPLPAASIDELTEVQEFDSYCCNSHVFHTRGRKCERFSDI